jgi:hypothetical protein
LLLKIAENYPRTPTSTPSMSSTMNAGIALSLVTALGRINVMLSVRLTATMADGVLQLIQPRRDELIWKHVAEALAKETWRDTC